MRLTNHSLVTSVLYIINWYISLSSSGSICPKKNIKQFFLEIRICFIISHYQFCSAMAPRLRQTLAFTGSLRKGGTNNRISFLRWGVWEVAHKRWQWPNKDYWKLCWSDIWSLHSPTHILITTAHCKVEVGHEISKNNMPFILQRGNRK